jgi:glycosyltransferase involved in cell wall biosynthesis
MGRVQEDGGLVASPAVSVVIATHNRPQAVGRLLEAVAGQTLREIEVVVVDDGSEHPAFDALAATVASLGPRFRLLRNEVPQGPSAARNRGVAESSGRFVTFCDDDDLWTRDDHLACAVTALEQGGLDLFFGEMAKIGAGGVPAGLWFEPVLKLGGAARLGSDDDSFILDDRRLADFLNHRILHANTLVIRRTLFEAVGGYWEKIRFAEDHDFALRLAAAAGSAAFRSSAVAQIDVSPHPSLSRRFDPREQLLMTITAVMHAESAITRPDFRRVARRNRAYRLVELAALDLADGQTPRARAFSWQALCLHPSRGAALMAARAWFGASRR